MNTCGTCKHKGEVIKLIGDETTDWEDAPTTFFLCARVKHDSLYKYPRSEHAQVTDGSGFFAALCVEDDFGCNLWEAK